LVVVVVAVLVRGRVKYPKQQARRVECQSLLAASEKV
jgi:hypothetical protein